MNAKSAHKLALKTAMQPVFAKITEYCKKGLFCIHVDNRHLGPDVRKELERLGYRVETGQSGTCYYIMW